MRELGDTGKRSDDTQIWEIMIWQTTKVYVQFKLRFVEQAMSMGEKLKTKLTAELRAQSVRVVDESHLHAGHAGAPKGGESHFHVDIVSESFSGLSRISRHRLVHKILATELTTSVHALSLSTATPTEVRTDSASNKT